MAERIEDAVRHELLSLLAAGLERSEAIAAAAAIPVRTARYRLAQRQAAGLVEMPTRGTWRLSGAGQRAALAASAPEPGAALDALDALPAEHRAMLRLIEDAVVARRALEAVYPSNWPAFLLPGPTKTGKTLLATIAARRLGLDPAATVRLLMLETPGSLLGRRVQRGPDAWEIVPGKLLGLPLVVLDEFDKASPRGSSRRAGSARRASSASRVGAPGSPGRDGAPARPARRRGGRPRGRRAEVRPCRARSR